MKKILLALGAMLFTCSLFANEPAPADDGVKAPTTEVPADENTTTEK